MIFETNGFFKKILQDKSSSKTEASNSSRKSDNLRGCDLLQEVSVTIRRFKKTSVPKERFVYNLVILIYKYCTTHTYLG